MAKNKSFFVG